jgi:hypothetical protein
MLSLTLSLLLSKFLILSDTVRRSVSGFTHRKPVVLIDP